MSDIICPLCGKPNSPDLDECQYCQAPLKAGGFLASPEEVFTPVSPLTEKVENLEEETTEPEATSNLKDSVPDWLKKTEASFLEPAEPSSEGSDSQQIPEQIESLINPLAKPIEPQQNGIDDDWLESLLEEAGAIERAKPKSPVEEPGIEKSKSENAELPSTQQEIIGDWESQEKSVTSIPQVDKPEWLANLEASSKIKLEGGIVTSQPIEELPVPAPLPEEKPPEPAEQPEWLTNPSTEPVEEKPPEAEAPIAPAELPGWLDALRPTESAAPSAPVEDVSGADVVTAGPLMGLRGVISARPSAIRAQKPPTYSIKLKVTEEQRARVQMMEELLADEEKPKPLPSKPVITSRYIFRLVVAAALLLPILWMIISNSQKSSTPQPGNIPGMIDFTQRIQALPANATVLIAFDYEAGFSGEMNIAITNVLAQLMKKDAYLALVATYPAGPALAESSIQNASTNFSGSKGIYSKYSNLGYLPGGTMGLRGLANSPRTVLPYALDATNVWAAEPLQGMISINDFAAVIVITNDPDIGRIWIEQIGTQLQTAGKPLLFITSAQAEPLILPYYEATPSQVQGLIAGITGGVAYARTIGNYQQNGVWDAYSAGITVSILIILIGSIAGVIMKMFPSGKSQES
jgi:hypothetical protein